MNVISNALHTLRVWMGFADATESHLTPSHGWLLPSPVDVRREHEVADAIRAERITAKVARER
jgi:hypothetical protein